MRGKVAKKLRKALYGDKSHRNTRYFMGKDGNAESTGLRRAWLQLKKDFKKGLNVSERKYKI